MISLIAFPLMCASQPGCKTDFRDGEFYIEVNKNVSTNDLNSFISKYNLSELNLRSVLTTNNVDTLYKLGWKIISNNSNKLVITRALFGSSDLKDPAGQILQGQHPNFAQMFPVVSDKWQYGYNRFRNKPGIYQEKNITRVLLRNFRNAGKVYLAGSFNDWTPDALLMRKTDSGWIAELKLKPGKYWYKFVIDKNWMVDNENLLRENDGLGNTNSVFFVTNHEFKLQGYDKARNVVVAGSFNNWNEKELKMNRTPDGWSLPIYLAEGTHRYKFLADKNWFTDSRNSNKLPDGHGSYNSVLTIGNATLFTLKGYPQAKQVYLAGNFNNWHPQELPMTKTQAGWTLNYVLAPGNYEYKYIVDGSWITDPSNPLTVDNEVDNKNSFLIVEPNYTFRVKGLANAKRVFLAGDFNNWSPNSLPMQQIGNEWVFKVHLLPGKHKYKLVVDGEWIRDPGNPQWEQNEFGTGNSVIWVDR